MREDRLAQERNASTSFLIVDAQSVANADTARHKGYDGGKHVRGIKRHIAVDTRALPHALRVTTANVDDRQGALAAIEHDGSELHAVESVLGDGGYTGAAFMPAIDKQLQATVQIAQRPLASAFEVIPQR